MIKNFLWINNVIKNNIQKEMNLCDFFGKTTVITDEQKIKSFFEFHNIQYTYSPLDQLIAIGDICPTPLRSKKIISLNINFNMGNFTRYVYLVSILNDKENKNYNFLSLQ